MRKKSQPWFFPLIILVAVFWLFGKKTPTAPEPAVSVATSSQGLLSTPAPSVAKPLVPSPQPESYQFVNADKLNQRDRPAGKVVSSLKRGEQIHVYERQNEWVRVSADGQPARWLSSKNLCDGAACYIASKRPTPPPSSAPKQYRQASPSYGASCSCSSGSVCIGPRGGRYCITSGGNKRYGV
ncbi:SH3 domain-containing protein [Pseudomonas spelaei]